jgi:hypothetical protein
MQLSCATCGLAIEFNSRKRTLVAAEGGSAAITYHDPPLLVWECPSCHQAQADELLN